MWRPRPAAPPRRKWPCATCRRPSMWCRPPYQRPARQSIQDIMKNIPGVGLSTGDGQRDQVFIRGFTAIGDQFVDGFRDDALYFRDLSNVERLEVIKGPAAVLYGRGSSGGLVNRISKKPGAGHHRRGAEPDQHGRGAVARSTWAAWARRCLAPDGRARIVRQLPRPAVPQPHGAGAFGGDPPVRRHANCCCRPITWKTAA